MMSSNTGKLLTAAIVGAALSWLAARGLPGGESARLATLEAGQQAILKELQGLKGGAPANAAPQAAPAPPALPSAPLSIAGSAVRGRADAPLTLIEFSDFQCPFCARHTRETFEQIQKTYVDTGKVRYVFRHFPIESLHKRAFAGAYAAECAARQGKFWEIHTRLFANQKQMEDADLLAHAKAIGVDTAAYQQCVTAADVKAKVMADLDEGARAGVSGTPMFFIGTMEGGKVRALKRLNGAVPFAAFQQTIDALLASLTPAPAP